MIKMKICIGGDIGAGKSTIAKKLAKEMNYKYYPGSYIYRKYIKKNNMTMLEVCKYPNIISQLDRDTDRFLNQLNTKDNFISDARLGYHFIRDSIKIYLAIDIPTATKRIYNSNRSNEKYDNIEDLKKEILERKYEERNRFLKLYNTNPFDTKYFDIIIDTKDKSIEEVYEIVLNFLKQK